MALTSTEFNYLRDLVQQHSAVSLEAGAQYFLEARLLPIAYEHGFLSTHQLLQHLREAEPSDRHEAVAGSLLADDTSFFRDQHPFEALKSEILPKLMAARDGQRELSIWSAGCGTGQEAYSLAMMIDLFFPQFRDWKVQLIGSDVARTHLTRAQEGCYNQLEVNRGLRAAFLVKYFLKEAPHWVVKPELRERVDFRHWNLAAEWPSLPKMDLIFFRNVLPGFSVQTREAVLRRIAQVLRPDGYLCLGAKENVGSLLDIFEPVKFGQAVFFRLKAKAAAVPGSLQEKYDLAPLPESVRRLAQLVDQRDDGTLAQILKVIAGDAELKTRLFRVANAKSNAPGPVETVQAAVMRTGMSVVLLLVMGNLLNRALGMTWRTMFSMGLEPADPAVLPADWPGSLAGSAQFSGKASGKVHIRMTPALGQKIAAQILSLEPDEVDTATVNEVIKEMANMVVGNFRSNLTDAGLPCKLSVPEVAQESSGRPQLAPNALHERLCFTCGDEFVVTDVIVNSLG